MRVSNIINKDYHKSSKTNPKIIIVGNIDYLTLITVILLVLFGITMVFSSSYYNAAKGVIANQQNALKIFDMLIKQSVYAIIGFLMMALMSNFNYRYLRRYSYIIFFIAIFLLILVLIIGIKVNGARRWILLPGGITFQPSEFAKFSIILLVSHLLSKYTNMLKKINGYIFISSVIIMTTALIAIENLSTAIIVFLIGFGTLFIASPHTKVFIFGGIASCVALATFIIFGETFRIARIQAWLDPFSVEIGYQTRQALFAVGSGGLFGLGLGQSRQKLGYLPAPENDIIFAIICEELGFFGATLILILFSILIWRGIKIAINSPDLFGSLLSSGIIIMIAVQVIINVSVVTNTIPNTGIPLPFISYGGTALVIMMTLIGILLNISRYSRIK